MLILLQQRSLLLPFRSLKTRETLNLVALIQAVLGVLISQLEMVILVDIFTRISPIVLIVIVWVM